ncbi:MAG: AAA family ATPase, partial [Elusimicrobiota bacterium]|nr:AAA family ATPase [Elusimicrobiota bacterium]
MNIIAVANQKGGVGKTTTSVNLSASLAYLGAETLLIDMDSQANCTSGLGFEKNNIKKTIYDVIIGEKNIEEVILPTDIDWLDIIPASIDLVGAEVEIIQLEEKEYILKNALKKIAYQYDYIIIDCPPSLGMLTLNSLNASNNVLIPIQCEYYALEGLGQLLNTIKAVKEHFNKELDIEGVVMTMFDSRVNLNKEVIENVKKYFLQKVCNTIIPRNIKLAEAP